MNDEQAWDHIAKLESELAELRRLGRQVSRAHTVFIFHEGPNIHYLRMTKGNFLRFDGCHINDGDDAWTANRNRYETKRQQQLYKLLYDDRGFLKHRPITKKEFQAEIHQGAKLIYCGHIL